jgi:hypothetical protein
MANLSQAEIDAILDTLFIGLLKRLSSIDPPSVEVNSHVDAFLERFTSVDALVDAVLKRNLNNQAHAQAVSETDLIVDDHHIAENMDNCRSHPAGDVVISINDVVPPSQTIEPFPSPSIRSGPAPVEGHSVIGDAPGEVEGPLRPEEHDPTAVTGKRFLPWAFLVQGHRETWKTRSAGQKCMFLDFHH